METETTIQHWQSNIPGPIGCKNTNNYNKISISSQILFVIAFLINLITTLAIVWVIFNSGALNGNTNSILIDELQSARLSSQINNDQLIFTKSLLADNLILYDTLRTNSLASEQISILAANKQRGPNAEISINTNNIHMQAESFNIWPEQTLDDTDTDDGGDGDSDGASFHSHSQRYNNNHNRLKFRLPRELNNLEALHGLENVRAIRSSAKSHQPAIDGRFNLDNGQLNIYSLDKLELSGNQGVKIYSKSIEISSAAASGEINFNSKEGSVILSSREGQFKLPLLERVDSGEIYDTFLAGARNQLCIDRNTGQLYQAAKLC